MSWRERLKWAVLLAVIGGPFVYETFARLPVAWAVLSNLSIPVAIWATTRLATVEPGQPYRGVVALAVFIGIVLAGVVSPLVTFM